MRSRWLVGDVDPSPGRVRLFCLPYAGGGASAYLPWRAVQDTLDIQPVKLAGRGGRGEDRLARRMDLLADQIATGLRPHLTDRFAIFGHSMGALVALEVTRRLQALGHRPVRLFASGRAEPDGDQPRHAHRMTDRELTAFLRDLGGTPAAVIDDEEVMAAFLPAVRSDLALCATYRFRAEPAVECPISVLYGQSDGSHSDGGHSDGGGPVDRYRRWGELGADTTYHGFPGAHFFPFDESRAEVLAHVIGELDGSARVTRYGPSPGR